MRYAGRLPAALAVLATSLVVVGTTAAPASAEECPTDARTQLQETPTTEGPTPLAAALDYPTLRADFPAATGVGVALLDTGVAGDGRLVRSDGAVFGASTTVESLHGTQVAGVIAASPAGGSAEGVAPGAKIYDVQVGDLPVPGDDALQAPTATSITQGLVWAAQNASALGIRVVTVSVGVAADPGESMRAPLDALAQAGVLVVAAQGDVEPSEEGTGLNNRPTAEPDDTPTYPAAYDLPNVLAVGSTPGLGSPETGTNRLSLRTDVVAPNEAITVAPQGGTCEVFGSAAYAAGVVSGVAALLFAYEPSWTGQQVKTRIVATAGGATDEDNAYTAAGSVQPVDALTRQLDVAPDGTLAQSTAVPRESVQAEAPEMPDDPLDESRTEFLWWGLLAGAAVGLALVLRPAVQRIRRRRR